MFEREDKTVCWTSKSGSSLVFQLSFRIGMRESNRRSLMTTIIIKSITGLCGAHNYSEIQGVYAYKGDAITARYTGCLSVLARALLKIPEKLHIED